ncbi:hypothetical protein HMI54_014277 [Coelomomyces lativittatus]|nr:hypothetical protein HMI55_002963 [Coelomomyces lativittatus]KAJ1514320.1 hypothetical protein HMI54_014277 [Coelomomyces lativittatus]
MPVPISTLPTLGWTLAEWRSHQRSQAKQASDTLQQLLLYLQKEKHPSWLYIASSKYVLQQLSNMQSNIAKYPYFGVPIAVKDNIDVADQPTTCGCPSFSYVPTQNAKCVQALMDLGFIVLGKTNMDQFATGLVGTRCATPVPNPFNQNRISGGSSSGSAYVVSVGWVPIALATDTAGSGRIPAAFNNIIGLKPSFGWISTEGVVPACLSLDCVAVFGLALKDIMDVFCLLSPSFRMESKLNQWQIAVPSNLVDNADEIYANAFQNCLQQWSKLPEVNLVPCDFTHLHQLANYLYDGPHLVERWEVVKNHIKKNGEQGIHPSILEVFKDVTKYSASDIFQGLHSIESLKQKIHEDLRHFQAILVPTSLFPPFLITEVDENNLELNRKLGSYTNFVNLAGWCGLSIPAGFLLYNGEKLPFGITLLAFKGRESWLLHLSRLWLIPLEMGALFLFFFLTLSFFFFSCTFIFFLQVVNLFIDAA